MELGMITDHKLRQDVVDELDFEPSLDASHIAVGVHDGVVTLTGSVPSYADKLAAERAARRVFGIRAIAQEIEIRLPSDKKTGDDEIAKRAADILRWRVGVPADRIAIKVEKGVVTLGGEVDWHFQRKQAENAVHDLTGVLGITNLIRVNARPQTREIKDKIQQALRRSASLTPRM
jgi:osmotically-inducible protein OsmY